MYDINYLKNNIFKVESKKITEQFIFLKTNKLNQSKKLKIKIFINMKSLSTYIYIIFFYNHYDVFIYILYIRCL